MSNHRFESALDNCRRSFATCITAIVLHAACSGRVAAQIDSDPTNDMQVTGDVLGLLPGLAVSNRAALVATPGGDVDFFPVQLSENDVVLGMTTPVASLPSDFLDPDTIASVFAFGSQATFSNDDDADELPSEFGNNASLFRFQAPFDSTYYVGITGIGDQEVDGAASGGTTKKPATTLLRRELLHRAFLAVGSRTPTRQTTRGWAPIRSPVRPARMWRCWICSIPMWTSSG